MTSPPLAANSHVVQVRPYNLYMNPPPTSMVSPVTKRASAELRKGSCWRCLGLELAVQDLQQVAQALEPVMALLVDDELRTDRIDL